MKSKSLRTAFRVISGLLLASAAFVQLGPTLSRQLTGLVDPAPSDRTSSGTIGIRGGIDETTIAAEAFGGPTRRIKVVQSRDAWIVIKNDM